jgi:membrane-bound lytic murein transglycosylase A
LKINIILLTLLVLCSCSHSYERRHKIRKVNFIRSNFSDIYGWHYDNHLASLKALSRSCEKIKTLNSSKPISNSSAVGGKAKQWQTVCKNLDIKKIKDDLCAKRFYEKWFTPYLILDDKGSASGKVTGYYEISINGSLTKTNRYRYPVYRSPSNLAHVKRSVWLSHAAINRGSLRGKGLEIVWVDNLARLHWMQIQGSGLINIGKSQKLRLGYDGQNGFDYTSVGPFFKKYGATNIKSGLDMIEWVHDNPNAGRKIIEHNKSYVFFKEAADHGPVGSQGVTLIPERSVAIDNGLYPFGMPIWVETTLPHSRNYANRKYRRLLISQDKGGAIKGALRIDIFFGSGQRAEELACYMNNSAKLFAMFPKSVSVQRHYRSK